MKLRALLFAFAVLIALPGLALAQSSSGQTSIQSSTIASPSCQMAAKPATINKGGSVTVSWQSANASVISITGVGANLGPKGSINLIPLQSTRYIGTFSGPGGKVTCEAIVVVLNNGTATGVIDAAAVSSPPKVPEPEKLESPPAQQEAPVLPTAVSKPIETKPSTGLIPCKGLDCQACHLAQLAQNIINFLVGLSIPLAAALIAWAGVIYFTSSVNMSVNTVDKAHKIFRSVIIGFLIVIGAWLGVQTVLKIMLKPAYYENWNTIQCIRRPDDTAGGRQLRKNISDLLNSLPLLNTRAQAPIVSVDYSGGQQTSNGITCREGGNCYDQSGKLLNAEGSGVSCDAYLGACLHQDGTPVQVGGFSRGAADAPSGKGSERWASQLSTICAQQGLSDCNLARAIMENESGGNCSATGPTRDYGCMQVTLGTARNLDKNMEGRFMGRSDAEVANILLNDPAYNMQLGVKEVKNCVNLYGYTDNAIGCYNGGAGASRLSKDANCREQGQSVWQCSNNAGYQVTRNYVQKVTGTYNKLK